MKRTLYNQLVRWKDSERRKPLMVYGARQVGKTYLLKEFGSREFDNMVYINCYLNNAIKELFSTDKDIDRLLLGLSAISGEEITPGRTLVFLDEVQDVPQVVASLKYFCEDAPHLHVAVAGSLLGVMNMEGYPFPTGKVDILHLFPMTFTEFLDALGENQKEQLLYDRAGYPIVNDLLDDYISLLRQYYFVGGMPEAVDAFISTKSIQTVRSIQQNIISAYEADIAKHAGKDTQKARAIFQAVPSQLARENKKFVFGAIRSGSRAAEYENAIQWLVEAGLVYKVCRLTKVAIPFSFYQEREAFKLFLLDVGLLGALAQIPPSVMLIGDTIFSDFKGAFTENYVLTQLKPIHDISISYYTKTNSTLEIDFLVQGGSMILPIEVKAEENVKSKSLQQFINVEYSSLNLHGYRFSMRGYKEQDWVTNIPLPAVYPFVKQLVESSAAEVSI
ncbi:MAG: AAA family ATPase [Muribaculaceae bacterium]|nr:AAA family ATPase [Muribaculaceae bacterium]